MNKEKMKKLISTICEVIILFFPVFLAFWGVFLVVEIYKPEATITKDQLGGMCIINFSLHMFLFFKEMLKRDEKEVKESD